MVRDSAYLCSQNLSLYLAVFIRVEYTDCRGTALPIGVNLTIEKAVKTAATQTKPACAGFKTVYFSLVRAGGLGFYSRDFQSLGLKLTPMGLA